MFSLAKCSWWWTCRVVVIGKIWFKTIYYWNLLLTFFLLISKSVHQNIVSAILLLYLFLYFFLVIISKYWENDILLYFGFFKSTNNGTLMTLSFLVWLYLDFIPFFFLNLLLQVFISRFRHSDCEEYSMINRLKPSLCCLGYLGFSSL